MTQPARPRVPVLHYLNQFFGGLGGEEQADLPPRIVPGPVGPGRLLQQLAPELEVVGTLIAGDNYVAEHTEQAVAEMLALVEGAMRDPRWEAPQLLLAGPAFRAGRYGLACGAVCRAVGERFGLPTVTAMHPESPGVEMYRRDVTIVRAASDVMGMQEAMEGMVRVARLLLAGGEPLPERDGTFPRGVRRNYRASASGAERAVEMLLRKVRGEPFETEYAMPSFDRVAPAAPIANPAEARIALVTSGGIVPQGNPDRLPSASAERFGEYSIEGIEALTAGSHQSVHGGYDPTYANEDPNRVLPLDAMRALEREGRIGRLHDRYYATVGNGTSVKYARQFGREIAQRLLADGVQAVVLTST